MTKPPKIAKASGPYCLPFKVMFCDGAWRHAATGDVLRCEVKGWRV